VLLKEFQSLGTVQLVPEVRKIVVAAAPEGTLKHAAATAIVAHKDFMAI
jgi:hypothetical protein